MENQWIVNAKDEYVINAQTESDYWRIRVKWDGCMDWEHSVNDPIEEAQADDVDRMHICSLATFAELVLHAALMVKQEWGKNDAVEDAEKALAILAEAASKTTVPIQSSTPWLDEGADKAMMDFLLTFTGSQWFGLELATKGEVTRKAIYCRMATEAKQ